MTAEMNPNDENRGSASSNKESEPKREFRRIGLALSGGGFRAALFHLGVIRRLEELRIMQRIDTLSAVSGGSIIAAYYVIEMEKRLRRSAVDRNNSANVARERLKIFDSIAKCFCKALDKNLRSRVMLFGPFCHPWLFARSFLPRYSRSDILQKEYDKYFYADDTLDHLPVFANTGGPKVVLNATSLLTGKRIGFTRRPVSGIRELGRINRNVLKLSQVVGASSAVPGVFPPTTISGDVLVDGGVSDNQGLEVLIGPVACIDTPKPCRTEPSLCDGSDFDLLIVSDACGQLELFHRMRNRILLVLRRAVSVMQYQSRQKLIRALLVWKAQGGRGKANEQSASGGEQESGNAPGGADMCEPIVGRNTVEKRNFAFVHLFLNLKDRCLGDRLPSEYIPALGRIRTDLDQFSYIEREALMYHGYTLIDAQLKRHCANYSCVPGERSDDDKLQVPPLFSPESDSVKQSEGPGISSQESQSEDSETESRGKPENKCASESARRRRVKQVLAAGSHNSLLLRTRAKYPWKSWVVFGPSIAFTVLLPLLGASMGWLDLAGSIATEVVGPLTASFGGWLASAVPEWLGSIGRWLWECVEGVFNQGLVWATIGLLLWLYLMLFVTFEAVRMSVRRWDRSDYRKCTGKVPDVRWG